MLPVKAEFTKKLRMLSNYKILSNAVNAEHFQENRAMLSTADAKRC